MALIRKDVGLVAGLVALSAVVRPSIAPAPAPPNPAPTIPAPVTTGKKAATGGQPEGPWKALCDSPVAGKWDCATRLHKPKFLFATVPDPKSTGLALFFDRSIESLLWSAAEAGYTFERYWLPWKSVSEKELFLYDDRLKQQADRDRMRAEPGLIVFRSAASGIKLLLFVVGETPTSGINIPQFRNALADAAAIAGAARQPFPDVTVVGPTFSGSLAGLGDELENQGPPNNARTFFFISGTVTSAPAACQFWTRIHSKASLSGRVHFDRVNHDDTTGLHAFIRYMKSIHKAPRKLALIAEDETEYGNFSVKGAQGEEAPLLIQYPRQIAQVRNAYQDRDSSQPPGQAPPIAGVPFSFKDASDESSGGSVGDSIPGYSAQLAASQDAAMSRIAASLRAVRADYAGIIATDVLDSLFVGTLLRKASPDTRIFFLDADLLFSRAEAEQVVGSLAVTTYPLLPDNQHWTRPQSSPDSERQIHFTSRAAEGIYNAVQFAIAEKPQPLDYSDPRDRTKPVPPLWLTVLGRDGYWPVALLDGGASSLTPAPQPPGGPLDIHAQAPVRAWFVLFWLVILGSALHSIYVLYLLSAIPRDGTQPGWQARCANRVHVRVRRALAAARNAKFQSRIRKALQLMRDSLAALGRVFPPYEQPSRRYGHKLPFFTAATLVLFCAVMLLALSLRTCWINPFRGWSVPYVVFAGGTLLLLFMVLVALAVASHGQVTSRRLTEAGTSAPRQISSFHEYWLIVVPMYALAASVTFCFIKLAFEHDGYAGFFFAYRSLNLLSGVSPVVPFLIAAIACFHWAWVHCWREDMIAGREALLIEFKNMHFSPPAGVREHVESVDGTLRNIFSPYVWRPALLVIVLWCILLAPLKTIDSAEPPLFDWTYIFVMSTLYWMLTLCWTQFIWVWRRFKKLLESIETDPVRNAFSRLRKEITWVPLVARVREHQYFITGRCVDCLRAILYFDRDRLSPADKPVYDNLRSQLHNVMDTQDARGRILHAVVTTGLPETLKDGDVGEYPRLQAALHKIFDVIRGSLSEHQWKRGDSDSVRREREVDSVKRTPPAERLLILEEEFVALRYLLYVRYVFRHLRNLLSFVVVGFILATLSLQSYAFQSRHWINLSSIFMLIALGAGVASVFAQMDRDAILSRITDTKSNELGKSFAMRLVQFGALPLITVLAGQFPSVYRIFFSWVRPFFDTMR